MKRWGTALAGLALVVVSCGGPAASPAKPGTLHLTPTASTASVAARTNLQSAILTLQDMPAGWTPSTDPPLPRAICDMPPAKNLVAEAQVAFLRSQSGPALVEILSRFPTGGAVNRMNQIRAQVNCPSFTDYNHATPEAISVSALSFPQVGDESYAVRLVGNDPTILGYAQEDLVYLRVGDVVAMVDYISLGTIDSGQTESFTRQAAAKLRVGA